MEKSVDAFRTISEVADDLDVPQHVLRFWETKFPQIKPMKRGGGRRYYRPEDVDLLRTIRHLLYGQGYTIRGVQRIFKEEGVRRAVDAYGPGGPGPEADELRPDESATGVAFEPETAEAEPDFAFEPDRPSAMRSQVAPVHSLPPHHRTLLEAALADLAECERLLVAAHP